MISYKSLKTSDKKTTMLTKLIEIAILILKFHITHFVLITNEEKLKYAIIINIFINLL